MEKKHELDAFERLSRLRINQLIHEHCGGSQQRFAEKTGLNKASVSQYVNGKNSPSNITANKIAQAFGVDAAWVMGFDLPTSFDEANAYAQHDPDLVIEAIDLYKQYQKLSPENQAVVRTLLRSLQSDTDPLR